MSYIKTFIALSLCVGLAACATQPTQPDDHAERVAQRDPIIQQEANKNAKLFKQTEDEIVESMQVADINYLFDSIRPPEYSYELLDKLANILKKHKSMKLIIEGNTDIVGDRDYNYWLGASRAAAMKSYLVSRGVLSDRIRIHSYGFDRPLTLDNSPEGRYTNRRVHFVLTTRDWQSVY